MICHLLKVTEPINNIKEGLTVLQFLQHSLSHPCSRIYNTSTSSLLLVRILNQDFRICLSVLSPNQGQMEYS